MESNGQPQDPEVNARGRKKIKPRGMTYDKDSEVTSFISDTIHGYYDGPWKTFTKVPEAVKNQWWLEFENKFYWEDADGLQILKNWRAKCSKHISSTFAIHRSKNTKPKWVSSENWAVMMKF